jgi:hypothetical protein
VKHLGLAAYKWLTMRLGVETVKPDVHVHRFVESAVGVNRALAAIKRMRSSPGISLSNERLVPRTPSRGSSGSHRAILAAD